MHSGLIRTLWWRRGDGCLMKQKIAFLGYCGPTSQGVWWVHSSVRCSSDDSTSGGSNYRCECSQEAFRDGFHITHDTTWSVPQRSRWHRADEITVCLIQGRQTKVAPQWFESGPRDEWKKTEPYVQKVLKVQLKGAAVLVPLNPRSVSSHTQFNVKSHDLAS